MIHDLGLIDYAECYAIQRELVGLRKLGEISDSLIVCEHNPVFTIGRTGSLASFRVDTAKLESLGAEILEADRGGDITFHSPGQVVLYPVIDLRTYGKDLHVYLRKLEDVVVRFLRSYEIIGDRLDGKTGVWVKGSKISFVGIAASNWITYHGVSINISNDLSPFDMIHPCGLKGITVTSLEKEMLRSIDKVDARRRIIAAATEVLNLKGEVISGSAWPGGRVIGDGL